MCKVGDLLLIKNATVHGKRIGVHPFMVLDDNAGIIKGTYSYDFIALLSSSCETDYKKDKLHKYKTNLSLTKDDKIIDDDTYINKDSMIEATPVYYFDKTKIDYQNFGHVSPDIYELVLEFFNELVEAGCKFELITDQATKLDS